MIACLSQSDIFFGVLGAIVSFVGLAALLLLFFWWLEERRMNKPPEGYDS